MNLLLQFRGEVAALSAALIWAIASYIYIHLGKRLQPMLLNAAKCTLAIAMTGLTLLATQQLTPAIDAQSFVLLFISGVVGIGLGDTVFFESLNCLGSRRALLLESLAPPLTAFLALLFLDEALVSQAWLGIGLTIAGVAWVVVEQTPEAVHRYLRPWRGITFGLLAALAQASGSVMSRAALVNSDISPLWSTLVRLAAGVLILCCWLLIRKPSPHEITALKSPRFLAVLAAAAFFSTFLAIWLQQTAYKYTAAGIAQSLTSTSPLFVLPIAVVLGETVSLRAVLGVVVAIAGIWLLFWQS